MQLELIESNVCQHLTVRAISDFFHCEHMYEPGNIPVYVFLGILNSTTDNSINYATRACFTFVQSQHMRKTQSFYVDPGDSIIGFIAFKTTADAQSDVIEFARGEHSRMLKKIQDVNKAIALESLLGMRHRDVTHV